MLNVRVQPRARSTGVGRFRDGVLWVRVSAAPVDGAANSAVIELVADTLGVAPRRVSVKRGSAARHKVLEIEGMSADAVAARLTRLQT